MKKIIWILFLLGSAVVCIAQPGYPVNLRNVIIGYQTTPEGLFFRGSHSPNHIPLEKYGTFMYVDTLTRQIWMYLDKDTVNGQPVGVWAKMYPSVSDLSSLTDVNTTGKIQNSMLIYDAVTSKWIIDNGTVYRKTTDTLSGQVYGAYNNTKLDSVSALYFDLDTPPVTLGVGMLSWDATTGTASLGLLGGNVQLKVGQQLVKRVVNKTTTNVNLLKSEYKVVKLLGASGSRISVDLAQANSEAGSAGTLGVVIEDINNNQEGFILVAGEITNINTTGTLVGETWSQGDVLYLSATTPGALTKVKPTPPNHTVIVGWVESVNANNGKIYVKIDNGYELEELHNVLTTGETNGSILYYDNGLWKASTGITLDNTGTLALNAVTANTLMYVDADKKLRSVTLTTTGSSGAATFSNGTLNIPQYAGSTDLTFSGASSPVTLNSSTGTDVTFTAGTNIAFSQAGNNLTINSTATSSNIYNSNGSIPAATTREVTVPDNSAVKFLETATKFTNIKGGSVLLQSSTSNTLEANTSGLFRSSSTSNGNSSVQLSAGQVGLYGNTGENLVTPGLFVTADNKAGFTTSSTGTSDSVVVKTAITNELKSLTPSETRTFILPSQATNANKYLKTNGTDVSWADIVAGVSSVTATSPLFSSGGATPNITIQQANTSQSGFLLSTDWNTFNSKQALLSGTGLVRVAGTTITYDNTTYVPASRIISTTSPLQGGGDLTADRTLSILDASDNGITKGASTYTANDFNSSSGLISIDYTNGQSASTNTKGFLTSTDWNTFNNKQAALTFTTPLTNTGNTITINQAGTSTNGFLTSTDWNTFNNKQNALTNPVTGTGAANKVAFWTDATTLSNNNNFHWDNTNGRLGIGTATTDSMLTVAGGISLTGGVSSVTGVNVSNGISLFSFLPQVSIPNERFALALTHTATSAADSPGGIVGLALTAQTPNTNFTYGGANGINAMRIRGFHAASTTLAVLNGVNFTVRNLGNGTVTEAVGGNFVMGNAISGSSTGAGIITRGTGGSYSLENSSLGTINTLRGINVQCNNNGASNSIQNFYGFHLTALTGTSGSYGTVYGLYIPSSWSTPATNKYGIYTADEGAINYIAGNTYMGATYSAPQARLHVAGSARIDDVPISKGGDGNINSIAIGLNALMSNTGTNANIAIGRDALKSNTSGFYNVALGIGTLASNVSDANSIAIGINALNKNNGGYFNVAVGSFALENNINGSNLTAFGYQALKANTTGTGNVGLGANALLNNTGGFNNVGIGSEALNNNVSGTYNAGVGGRALFANTGNHNFGLGAFALENKITGDNNVAIGNYAGQVASNSSAVTNISNSIFIGYATRPSIASGNTNEIVIGTSAIGNGSNTTTIGNSSTTKTVLPGGTLTLSGSPPAIVSNSNQVLLRNTSTGEVSSLVGTVTDQVLKWDNTSSRWYAGTDAGGGGATGLTSLNGLSASSQTFAVGASPGISISSAASSHTFTLANQALAFHNLATNGIVVRTGTTTAGLGTAAVRTITGTSPITVTNGDGVSDNPTIALSTVPITSGGTGQTTQQAALNALAGATTSGHYLRGNGTNVTMSAIQAADVTGVVAAASGGTGLSSYAVGDLIQATGSTTLSRLASVASGNVLLSGGVATASSWGKVGLTSHVTGTLPVANGGTNTTTAPAAGQTLIATNTTTYTPITPSIYTNSATTPITWDVNYRSSGVYRISNTSTATITGVTVSNVVTGGIYAFHISGASNTVTITVQWPVNTFKDLTDSTDYGTRVYTTPTIITCYYDGANFVCE